MRDVAIIGIGITKFGELWDKSLRDLFVDAALLAIKDSGVDKLDSMYVGCMSGGLFNQQEHIGALMADYLGVNPIPALRVESACASGGMSVRQGFMEVASGMSDIVLAGGIEKMNDISGDEATFALASAADAEYESFFGITFPGLYAMIAHAYMERYNATSEHLAHIASKNHYHGSMNPNAQFPQQVTPEQVLGSTMVADPLHILDCSPVTDGAAAVILASVDVAKKLKKDNPMVVITGTGAATDTIALHSRKDITYLNAVEKSATQAYSMAGKNPNDIQLCEVHDCFTIAEAVVVEALGFFERGQGAMAAKDGATRLGGKKPINTSGGLKSKGHPVGATGVAQVCEIVTQLRGTAGDRQVKDARIGMTQNMGGSGASSVCHIMEVK
jgi:acetyl-CoA C-acetyltransferase